MCTGRVETRARMLNSAKEQAVPVGLDLVVDDAEEEKLYDSMDEAAD